MSHYLFILFEQDPTPTGLHLQNRVCVCVAVCQGLVPPAPETSEQILIGTLHVDLLHSLRRTREDVNSPVRMSRGPARSRCCQDVEMC